MFRIGFEANKDLPTVKNTMIAGTYYVTKYLGSAALGCKTSVCSLCWLAARKWILIYWLSFSWMPIIAKTNLIMLWVMHIYSRTPEYLLSSIYDHFYDSGDSIHDQIVKLVQQYG
ncbi:uncharacterized protein LOC121052418 [Rosa chinensis]|uniref:uncharacterized protein LOC121052418 n=1 Tax=Rosa chinensis TaxID=74649 RepID=UPI001AD920AA|nr:uncharacterized protein LOC121052418 [Rosa chinensis]